MVKFLKYNVKIFIVMEFIQRIIYSAAEISTGQLSLTNSVFFVLFSSPLFLPFFVFRTCALVLLISFLGSFVGIEADKKVLLFLFF